MKNFDERQLWARGDAFRHGFIILCILVFLDSLSASMMTDSHIFGSMSGVVMIMFTTMIVTIELIRKKAYEWAIGGNKIASCILIACSLFAFVYHAATFIQNGMPINTVEGRENLGLCLTMLFLLIFAVYYFYDMRKTKNSEEEE